jgi:hypothetical protein
MSGVRDCRGRGSEGGFVFTLRGADADAGGGVGWQPSR